MTRCLYCLSPVGDPPNAPSSLEHIIPYAIGGSDDFATRSCCKKCNDRLGSTVDAAFVDDPLLLLQRAPRELRGHSGKEPSLSVRMVAENGRSAGKLNFRGRAAVFEVAPVTKMPQSDGSFSFCGESNAVKSAVATFMSRAHAGNQSVCTTDKVELTNAEQIAHHMTSELAGPHKGGIDVDLDALCAGIFKIGYGAAFFMLGDEWLGTETAEKIRRVLVSPSEYSLATILDHLSFIPPEDTTKLLNPLASAEVHYVGYLPVGRPVMLIRLFGESFPAFLIDTGGHNPMSKLVSGGAAAVSVDYQKRTARKHTFKELLEAHAHRNWSA